MPYEYRFSGRESTHALCYACNQCLKWFHLDTVLSIIPVNENDAAGEVGFFGHEHPLRRFHMKEKIENNRCRGCRRKAMGELYGCIGCQFYLHERCFGLLLVKEIQHPLHPDHPLKPVNGNHYLECVRCGYRRRSLGYSCDRCHFFIDMRCADMTLSFEGYLKDEEKGSASIIHSTHNHELTKFSVKSEGETILCDACHRNVKGLVYSCRDCLFFLHEECAESPSVIQHYLHPQHSLTLGNPNMKFHRQCNGCNTALYGLVYKCEECSFDLHMECALQTLSFVEQGLNVEVEHPVYKCLMTLFYSHREPKCSACGEVVIGPAYFYEESSMIRRILRKSCTELSLEIQHPFHTKHPLALDTRQNHGLGKFQCHACRETKSTDSAYFCGECKYYLCVVCSSRELTLKHPLHEHRLAYFGETEHLKCSLCHKGCNADLYRCVPCNFNLHQDCLPLPKEVKCRHHIDRLVLHEKIIEDDSGEYYCDICSQRRDPDHGAFYCASCKMITDIKCMLSMAKHKICQ